MEGTELDREKADGGGSEEYMDAIDGLEDCMSSVFSVAAASDAFCRLKGR